MGADKGTGRPDIKRQWEVARHLGLRRPATKDEVVEYNKQQLEYEASQGRKVITRANEEGVTVDEYLDKMGAVLFIRKLYTKKKVVELFDSSHITCVTGNSHMAAERMQEKFLDIAFGDPKKLGLNEEQQSPPVTIIFDDSIREVKE